MNSDAKELIVARRADAALARAGDSWLAASFGDTAPSAGAMDQALTSNPSAKGQVAQAEAALGIKLDNLRCSGERPLFQGRAAALGRDDPAPQDIPRGAGRR